MPEKSSWEKTVPLDKSISSLYNISRRTIISQEHKSNNSPYWFIEFGEVISRLREMTAVRLVLRGSVSRISSHTTSPNHPILVKTTRFGSLEWTNEHSLVHFSFLRPRNSLVCWHIKSSTRFIFLVRYDFPSNSNFSGNIEPISFIFTSTGASRIHITTLFINKIAQYHFGLISFRLRVSIASPAMRERSFFTSSAGCEPSARP